jgi:mono/diheme cytochrome c family protein
MASLSDKQIVKAIRGGGAALGLSPQMPAWGGVLSQKQAADLTVFIRTFAQHDNPGK